MIDEKLANNVFKPSAKGHLAIRPGKETDGRLKLMVKWCPAGLYREGDEGKVSVSLDGCLECGTCRVICGSDVLIWQYPDGGEGVQYRFG